jgi:hypothetical protein
VYKERVHWIVGEQLPELICVIKNKNLILNAGLVKKEDGSRKFFGECRTAASTFNESAAAA